MLELRRGGRGSRRRQVVGAPVQWRWTKGGCGTWRWRGRVKEGATWLDRLATWHGLLATWQEAEKTNTGASQPEGVYS